MSKIEHFDICIKPIVPRLLDIKDVAGKYAYGRPNDNGMMEEGRLDDDGNPIIYNRHFPGHGIQILLKEYVIRLGLLYPHCSNDVILLKDVALNILRLLEGNYTLYVNDKLEKDFNKTKYVTEFNTRVMLPNLPIIAKANRKAIESIMDEDNGYVWTAKMGYYFDRPFRSLDDYSSTVYRLQNIDAYLAEHSTIELVSADEAEDGKPITADVWTMHKGQKGLFPDPDKVNFGKNGESLQLVKIPATSTAWERPYINLGNVLKYMRLMGLSCTFDAAHQLLAAMDDEMIDEMMSSFSKVEKQNYLKSEISDANSFTNLYNNAVRASEGLEMDEDENDDQEEEESESGEDFSLPSFEVTVKPNGLKLISFDEMNYGGYYECGNHDDYLVMQPGHITHLTFLAYNKSRPGRGVAITNTATEVNFKLPFPFGIDDLETMRILICETLKHFGNDATVEINGHEKDLGTRDIVSEFNFEWEVLREQLHRQNQYTLEHMGYQFPSGFMLCATHGLFIDTDIKDEDEFDELMYGLQAKRGKAPIVEPEFVQTIDPTKPDEKKIYLQFTLPTNTRCIMPADLSMLRLMPRTSTEGDIDEISRGVKDADVVDFEQAIVAMTTSDGQKVSNSFYAVRDYMAKHGKISSYDEFNKFWEPLSQQEIDDMVEAMRKKYASEAQGEKMDDDEVVVPTFSIAVVPQESQDVENFSIAEMAETFDYKYGSWSDFGILEEGSVKNNSAIVYSESDPGRGVKVSREGCSILFEIEYPNGPSERDVMYRTVLKTIRKYNGQVTLIWDGKQVTLDANDYATDFRNKWNETANLRDGQNEDAVASLEELYPYGYMQCATHRIFFDPEQENAEEFCCDMYYTQSKAEKPYVCEPKASELTLQDENGDEFLLKTIVLPIIAERDGIFPAIALLREMGDYEAYAFEVSGSHDKTPSLISYKRMITYLRANGLVEKYDLMQFVLRAMSQEEIDEMLKMVLNSNIADLGTAVDDYDYFYLGEEDNDEDDDDESDNEDENGEDDEDENEEDDEENEEESNDDEDEDDEDTNLPTNSGNDLYVDTYWAAQRMLMDPTRKPEYMEHLNELMVAYFERNYDKESMAKKVENGKVLFDNLEDYELRTYMAMEHLYGSTLLTPSFTRENREMTINFCLLDAKKAWEYVQGAGIDVTFKLVRYDPDLAPKYLCLSLNKGDVIRCDVGNYALDKTIGAYNGYCRFNESLCYTILHTDKKSSDNSFLSKMMNRITDPTNEKVCSNSLAMLRKILKHSKKWDAKCRYFAAYQLVEEACEWSDNEELSTEDLAKALVIEALTVHEDGRVEFYYSDVEHIFEGHSIVVYMDSYGNLTEANIEG